MLKSTDWLLDPRSCPGYKKSEVISRIERAPYIHHTEYLFVELPKRYALVSITHGELDFGTWQQIFYAEFDGKRTKRILVKITGLAKQ